MCICISLPIPIYCPLLLLPFALGHAAGISQRDVTTFYEFLAGESTNSAAPDEEDEENDEEEDEDEGCIRGGTSEKRNEPNKNEKARLRNLLLRWFFDHKCNSSAQTDCWLTDALGMTSYSADVYIDRQNRVFLIDINVFGYPSDSLLFDWEELLPCTTPASVPFVTLQSRADERPSPVVQGQQQGPIDVHSAPDFSRFMQIVREQRGQADSTSSGDDNTRI
jgi:hypothetical protein